MSTEERLVEQIYEFIKHHDRHDIDAYIRTKDNLARGLERERGTIDRAVATLELQRRVSGKLHQDRSSALHPGHAQAVWFVTPR